MTDRLTPPQIWDLADLMERYERYAGSRGRPLTRASWLREEAARREAEAKPQSAATGHYENDCEELGRTGVGQDSARPLPQGEREGPGSAAAPNAWRRECPHSNVMCESPVCREYGCQAVRGEAAIVPEDEPAPADDLPKVGSDYAIDLQRLIETLCHGATVLPAPLTTARHHRQMVERRMAEYAAQAREIAELKRLANSRLEFANQYAAQLGEAEARVRELERECGQWQEASGQANVRAEQLEDKWEAEKARADKAEARVRELEAELAAERDSRQIAQDTCDMQKARADGLAANKAVLIEALKLCRELADHIAKAPLPLFRAQAAKVRDCIDDALTAGGA